MLPVARRVPLALVAGALLVGLLAVDLASVSVHGVGSPARGAAFLLVVAWAVGRLAWGLARGSRSPTTSFVLPIPLGVAVLALVYAAAVAAGAQRAYPIVAYGLALASFAVLLPAVVARTGSLHWAAFFGHRFFFLRRGRWATAYPDFQERWRDNDALFRMSDRDAALALAKKHGITHVVDEVSRPSPWLASERPLGENAYYRVYDLRPLVAAPTAPPAP